VVKAGTNESAVACGTGLGCCKVESVVTVDARGQMVLPKEVRERAGIQPGDKLALLTVEDAGQVCCICLVRAAELTRWASELLGPLMADVVAERGRQEPK
jgi:antitoxin PrlF